MEFLDIRDKNGNPTGEVKERSLVHADGDIHGTSHVWIVRKNEKGSYDLLLQNVVKIKMHFPDAMIFLLQDIYQQVRIIFLLH